MMRSSCRLFTYSRRRPSLTLIFICFLLALSVRDCAAKCDPRKLLSNDKTKNNERRHDNNTLVGEDRMGYGCTKDDIVVYQSPTAPLPMGMPAYNVHILNECMPSDCELSDIHLSCEWFASTELINPRVFRRIDYDDCLVNDGEPLPPGGLSFMYTNSFSYPLSVSHAACN